MKDNIKEKALKLEFTKSEVHTLEVDLEILQHPRWSESLICKMQTCA